MGMPCFFVHKQAARRLRPFLWLCSFLLAFLCIFSSILFKTASGYAAQVPACAPDTPSPVSGAIPSASPHPGLVLINEVLSNPASTWNCSEPPGSTSRTKNSWIEIYNPQKQALDLYAAQARISLDEKKHWAFLPQGSAVTAGGHLVLFPLTWFQTELPEISNVALDIGGTIVDQASIPLLAPNQSYARIPDGSRYWQSTDHPTINASNILATPEASATTSPIKTPQKGNDSLVTPVTPANSGTQTAWNQIQLPHPPVPNLSPMPTTLASLQHPLSSDEPASRQKIGTFVLITILLLLLSGVFVWCWRLFRSP